VGRITGWYPYFFLDLGQTSPAVVALYCVAILILLLVVSCLFWMGDRWLPGRVAVDDEPTVAPRLRPGHPQR